MKLRTRNDQLLRELEPFLVVAGFHEARMDLAPFGLRIPARNVLDPLRMRSAPFLHMLQRLDALTFGPEGMPMPGWVFFDGAELPGAIFGLGRRAAETSPEIARALGMPRGYRGVVPYAMFIAIPTMVPGAWMGHNLASLNPVFPREGLRGLASLTKSLGLRVFRCQRFFGITQWRSRALHIHTRFGPLEIVTAYTPAHSEARSVTYAFTVTEERLRAAAGDPEVSLPRPAPTHLLDADDEAEMRRIHAEVRVGVRWEIAGAPAHEGTRVRVPLARVGGQRSEARARTASASTRSGSTSS